MFVCVCNAVTEKEVRAAIAGGARTRDDVTSRCGAGGDCGSCHHMIEQMIEEELEASGELPMGVDGKSSGSTTGPVPLVAAASLVRGRAA